jgi:hypothetical protein
MLITNMCKTNTDIKNAKKLYRIINIGTLKNETYGTVQFIKPKLEIFNEEKDHRALSETGQGEFTHEQNLASVNVSGHPLPEIDLS